MIIPVADNTKLISSDVHMGASESLCHYGFMFGFFRTFLATPVTFFVILAALAFLSDALWALIFLGLLESSSCTPPISSPPGRIAIKGTTASADGAGLFARGIPCFARAM